MNEILQIKNLMKSFKIKNKTVNALNDISFDINKGECLGIVGESGSGKSTLARCLMGLYKDAKGQIIYQNKNILEFNKKEYVNYWVNVQMIFQDPYSSLNPRKTCFQIISEGLKNLEKVNDKKELEKRVLKTMEICGLSKFFRDRYPYEFSGGQRQRISIARAIAVNPKIIIADEPTSALDVSIQAQIINLLSDLKSQYGLTLVFISHDLALVKHIADQVLVMQKGSLKEKNTVDEIFENPKDNYTKKLLSSLPKEDPNE